MRVDPLARPDLVDAPVANVERNAERLRQFLGGLAGLRRGYRQPLRAWADIKITLA